MTNDPVVYSRALADRICALLQVGRTLKVFCVEPAATVGDRDGLAAAEHAPQFTQAVRLAA